MIARGGERRRQAGEHAGRVVGDRAGLAVHDLLGLNDLAAEHLADRLMTQANPEYGKIFRRALDQVQANARLVRIARAGA